MALTDVDKIRSYLGTKSIEPGTEELLDWLISVVESHIQTRTGRMKLESDSLTEYHDGDGKPCFLTNEFPVTAVASLYDDLDRNYTSGYLIDPDDYVWYSDGLVELETGTFNDGLKNIKITYTAGYATTDEMWPRIEYLATKWTAMIFMARKRLGISSQTTPDGSQTFFNEFLDRDMMDTLNALTDRRF